jgi:hypothetical protein
MKLQGFDFSLSLIQKIDGHCRNTLIRQFHTWKGLNYVSDNFYSAIKWSTQQPNPLEAEVQNIPYKMVNREKFNSNVNNSMIKATNSFITAKGSMPILHKNTKPTGTKCKLTIKVNHMQLKGSKHSIIQVKML